MIIGKLGSKRKEIKMGRGKPLKGKGQREILAPFSRHNWHVE